VPESDDVHGAPVAAGAGSAPGGPAAVRARVALERGMDLHLRGSFVAAVEAFETGLADQDSGRSDRGLLRAWLGWLPFSRFWTAAFSSSVFALLGGAAERQHEWRLAWSRPEFPSPWGFAARLEQRAPRLGRVCRNAVKVARLLVCRVVAWPVAVGARYLTR